MIMCVLLCYPVSIRINYQQGVLFLVVLVLSLCTCSIVMGEVFTLHPTKAVRVVFSSVSPS